MATITSLGSISRIDIDNPTSFSNCFVFDKTLQLSESPLMIPRIVFGTLPDVSQILHYNNASTFNTLNNLFADVMILPSHKPFPFARQIFELPFAGSGAFGLKFTNKLISFYSESFGLLSEELAVRYNSKFINSEVNAKNSGLQVRDFSINLFGECEKKETSALLIYSHQTFFNIPFEIFFIAVWNRKIKFLSAFDCSQTQYIIFNRSTSGKIISHRNFLNNWFGLCSFNNSARLFDTSNSQLRLQSILSQMLIHEWMQLNIIFNMPIPSFINTELQSFRIDFESFDYLWSCCNFDLNACSDLHINSKELGIFKNSDFKRGKQFLPASIGCGVSLLKLL